jgi:hypothetical protein
MVRDALRVAADFKSIELETMEQLSPIGAGLPVDAVSDLLGRLNNRRLWVVSLLICAEREAENEQERQDVKAALLSVNTPLRAF